MAIITYDGDEFKSIDCIPEYADYPTIYVAKTPHVDETGRSYQVINTAWGNQKTIHPILSSEDGAGYLFIRLPRVGNKRPNVGVHRLIILTWGVIPEGYQELQVNHIDENKHNNNFSNLKLLKRSDHTKKHKSNLGKTFVLVKCPCCNIVFEREKRQSHLSKGTKYTSCSKECSGKISNNINTLYSLKDNILDEYKKYN